MSTSAVFRAYDIRGLVDKDFNAEWVYRLGQACASVFLAAGHNFAIVGHDCRISSPEYHEAMVSGLAGSGVDVISIGMVPTPCLYFAIKHLHRMAGVMITASHNPADYNGFKIWLDQTTLFEKGIQNIRQVMEAGNFSSGSGLASKHNIVPAYLDDIVSRLGPVKPFKVVVDGGNGAGGEICCELLRRMGAEVIPLYCEPDGRFPNHHPDPVIEKNMLDLRRAVLAHEADMGFGLDGDADRLGVMDKKGRLLFGDELVAIYARDLLMRHPGATILGDSKCSQRLFDDIAARGGVPEMTRTGHSVVKARLREMGGLLAGELSGHMFHAENWYGFDDALYSAARLLAVLTRLDMPLEDLPGWLPAFNTPEISLPCPDAMKFEVVSKAKAYYKQHYPVSEVDGARVLFADGWGLVRASNTSPNLVLRFEAASPERLQEIKAWMEAPLADWIAGKA